MRASEYFKAKTKRNLLYNLCPVQNVANVVRDGLLSHQKAASRFHKDVSDEKIQSRRNQKIVNGRRPLHEYANLYFDFRNPMFFRLCREGKQEEIALLVFDCAVLDLPGCLIADRNAASGYATFFDPLPGLRLINFDLVYAQYWAGSGDYVYDLERKAIKNAEVLVPEVVPFSFIMKKPKRRSFL